jgi:hypothetical protein
MVEPVILELAVNGATPRHRNRHVPRTPAEITEAALAGIESGASIVHNHNDEPMFTADGCTLSSRTWQRGDRCWNVTRMRCCTRRWPRERGESR